MALRKIQQFTSKDGETATVYRDSEWNEYRVKFTKGLVHHKPSDYHTDDYADAVATARLYTH